MVRSPATGAQGGQGIRDTLRRSASLLASIFGSCQFPTDFAKVNPPQNVSTIRHGVAQQATMDSEVDDLCGELTLAKNLGWQVT
jgi:hypothetical protein